MHAAKMRRAARRDDAPVDDRWLRLRRLLVLLDAGSAAAVLVCLHFFLSWHGIDDRRAIIGRFVEIGLLVLVTLLLVFYDGRYSVGYRLSRWGDVETRSSRPSCICGSIPSIKRRSRSSVLST